MGRKSIMVFVVGALLVALTATAALAVVKNGNNGPNRLVGTAQNDSLNGHRGNDVLIGRADSDRLYGGRATTA